MEFSPYPVYHSKVIPVKSDFEVLNRFPLVLGLPPEELLAEKITAALGRPYFKGRDSFDLWYLSQVLSAKLDMSLVKRKFGDYGVSWSGPWKEKRLAEFRFHDLNEEMNRFLPQRFQDQLQRDNYQIIRFHAVKVLDEVGKFFSSGELER